MSLPTPQEPDRLFYHALYHVVAHWAAVVGIAGLLATSILLIGTTSNRPTGSKLWICGGALVGLALAGIVFAWRMIHFSEWVKSLLKAPNEYEQGLFSHRSFFVITIFGFVALGAFSILLLLGD